MTKRSTAPVQVVVVPMDNIFEPRENDSYPSWVNSTAISMGKTNAKDKLHRVSKSTKVKGSISKNMKPKMNNLNIKTIKSSLENFFNPSKRIGRQQDIAIEAKYQFNPIPTFGDNNCKLNNFKSTSVINTKPVVPLVNHVKPAIPIAKLPVLPISKIDQLPAKPLRMGVRTLSAKPQADKIDSTKPVARKFPVMGVSAKIFKSNKAKLVATKQWESDMIASVDNIIKKDLTPFLDSCDFDELLPAPVMTSTFATNKTFTKFADAVDSTKSPVSIKSKAKFATVAPYFKI